MAFCCIVTGSDPSDAILMFPALLTYINFVSVKLFVRVQNVFTVSKLLACVIIIISGVYAICVGECRSSIWKNTKFPVLPRCEDTWRNVRV